MVRLTKHQDEDRKQRFAHPPLTQDGPAPGLPREAEPSPEHGTARPAFLGTPAHDKVVLELGHHGRDGITPWRHRQAGIDLLAEAAGRPEVVTRQQGPPLVQVVATGLSHAGIVEARCGGALSLVPPH